MGTWVEDIVQALRNLGGQGSLDQIYNEVRRIRKEPLPATYTSSIRGRIEENSSDSHVFKGTDLFHKVDKGVWALREQEENHISGGSTKKQVIPGETVSGNGEAEHMATWLEDIVQALKNLGGQATLTQIYEEVERIRQSPLPKLWQHIIQDIIYQHSSDTQKFKGNDLFHKVDKGVWALREQEGNRLSGSTEQWQVIPRGTLSGNGGVEHMATWLEDIVQALKNLGGWGTRDQIFAEVKRIRSDSLSPSWKEIITQHILSHSSDSQYYDGKKSDLFVHVANGVWALRNQAVISQESHPVINQSKPIPYNYQFSESFEEIANILRTIKQYRDYQHPDSPTWKEYVDEFFHILGFSIDEKNSGLMTLNVMGSNHTPKAIVGFIRPGKNLEEIAPGLLWEPYLLFAANYYQINWGILTDGLQLKIIHYQDHDIQQPMYWPDFDGIIQHEKLDTFCTIFKIFSYIKGDGGKIIVEQGEQLKNPHSHGGEKLPDRYVLRLEFWGQLLEKAKAKTKLHAKVKSTKDNWISAGAGISDIEFNYVIRMDDAQVELLIDRGDAEFNKRVFNAFLQNKHEIEDLFGGPLDWQLLPNKLGSRIRFLISDYGLKDQEHWDELQEQMIESMIRLEKAFRPYLNII